MDAEDYDFVTNLSVSELSLELNGTGSFGNSGEVGLDNVDLSLLRVPSGMGTGGWGNARNDNVQKPSQEDVVSMPLVEESDIVSTSEPGHSRSFHSYCALSTIPLAVKQNGASVAQLTVTEISHSESRSSIALELVPSQPPSQAQLSVPSLSRFRFAPPGQNKRARLLAARYNRRTYLEPASSVRQCRPQDKDLMLEADLWSTFGHFSEDQQGEILNWLDESKDWVPMETDRKGSQGNGEERQCTMSTTNVGSGGDGTLGCGLPLGKQNDNDEQPGGSPDRRPADHEGNEGNPGEGDDGGDVPVVADAVGANALDLTSDLLHKVFSFLDDVGLCKAAMVCRLWRDASAHEDFWMSLNFEDRRHVSHAQVKSLCSRYPKATLLNLKGAACADDALVQEVIQHLKDLETLVLGGGSLGEGFFWAVRSECPSLLSLSITDSALGQGGSQEIQLRHERIRTLYMVKCRVLRIAIRCPGLETLSLRKTGTASAVLECPRLVNLDLSCCNKLSDAGVRAAASSCTSLQVLSIAHCAYVSDETLREIATACPNLTQLDASHCPNISLEGVRMPSVTELKLMNCEGINSASMAALVSFVQLELLVLDYCWLLTTVNIDLPRLRSISLMHCKKLADVSVKSPVLGQINVQDSWPLNRIDLASAVVERLSLRNQTGLYTVDLHCPRLREVDLSDCDALNDSIFQVFSNDGGCPQLTTLTLDGCEGLKNVELASSSIVSLSLVGCHSISSLKLACPSLNTLLLNDCDHLVSASFNPIALTHLNLGICPHLESLTVQATSLVELELRGCGALRKSSITCPSLVSLDALYCGQMGDDCLSASAAACPSIRTLVLASCHSVSSVGLQSLRQLSCLNMLDLSYTEITELQAVFDSCSSLKVLHLNACKWLQDDALVPLHHGVALPELVELNISYCNLSAEALGDLLAFCPHLTHVSLSGCQNVSDALWDRISQPAQPLLALASTGNVARTGVSVGDPSCWLSLAPPGPDSPMSEGGGREHADISTVAVEKGMDGDASAMELDEVVGPEGRWVERDGQRALQVLTLVCCPKLRTVTIPAASACWRLSVLNLSLSNNLHKVQLACSNLTSLNLSNCAALVSLQLNCPRITNLHLQGCGLEPSELEHAVSGCTSLETLDVRGCPKVSSDLLDRVRLLRPCIRRLYNSVSG